MPNKTCNQPQHSVLMIISEWHSITEVKSILCKSRHQERGIKSNHSTMKRQSRGGKDNFSKSNFLTEKMDL